MWIKLCLKSIIIVRLDNYCVFNEKGIWDIINITDFAVSSIEYIFDAIASVTIDSVDACPSVLARVRRTLVDICIRITKNKSQLFVT